MYSHVKKTSNQKRLATTLASGTLLAVSASVAFGADDLAGLDLSTLMQMDVTLVTAQKRTENVDTVPISMTVLKANAIKDLKLDGTPELQFAAPGLTTSTNAFWMLPYIRGVGNDINSSGLEPSVAVYVDGVYQPQRVATFADMADVERIEVLRGPQGTLYGRNATGGAINIVTRGPSEQLEGAVDVSAGNLDLREGSLFVAGPLNERLSASFSGHARKRDGYYENVVTGADVLNDDYYTLHGRAQLEVTDSMRAELMLKHFDSRADHSYGTEVSGNSLPAMLGAQVATQPFQTASNMDSGYNHLENTTTALKLNWDLPAVRLQSITARNDQRHKLILDFDLSTATLAHFRANENSDAFTQEIQLSPTDQSGRFDWLFGAFYIQSDEEFAPLTVDTTVPPIGAVTQRLEADVLTHSYAAFGEATVKLSEFSLTGGLRYSNEVKRLDDIAMGLQGTPLMSLPDRRKQWDDVNYRLVAKYVHGASMFYAKTETGFKSGAFNNGNLVNPGPIDPERITAYELGVKTLLPNYPVRLSAAVFYNDYRDLQIQVVDSAAGGVSQLVQAPKAETYGLDFNAAVKPAEYWSITGGVALLKAEYREFIASGILIPNPAGGFMTGNDIDLKGNHLSRSPELTANLTVAFDYPVPTGAIFGATNYYRSSRLYFDPANAYSQDAFGMLNAQIGYRSHARWSVSAWAKNLTATTYLSTVIPGQLGAFGVFAEPRTYGITMGYSLGQ